MFGKLLPVTGPGEESEEDFIATDGASQPFEEALLILEASGGDCQTSDGALTLEDYSKTQVEAAQATDGLLASQETSTTAEAVLVTQETSGDLHRSQDFNAVNQMDDTSVTDPGNKSDPVNDANPVSEPNPENKSNPMNEANPVSEANQVNKANQAAKGQQTHP